MTTVKGSAERDKFNAYRKEVYQWRKEHHICVQCGREETVGELVRCPKCLEKSGLATYRLRHKNDIKCVHCSDPVYNGTTMCYRHLIAHRAATLKYMRKVRSAGNE